MNLRVQKVWDRWVFDQSQIEDIYFQNRIEEAQKNGVVEIVFKTVGAKYTVEQQGLWHKLVGVYYKSGMHSCNSYEDLRTTLKYRYGIIAQYVYILEDGGTVAKRPYDPPPSNVHEKISVMKSTALYKKEEYSHLIDGTIAEMKQSGILQTARYSEEFLSILETLGV